MSFSRINKTGGSWFSRAALSIAALAVLSISMGVQAPAASAAKPEKTVVVETVVVETAPIIKVIDGPIQTLRSASWN